jgi:hypothetical protein
MYKAIISAVATVAAVIAMAGTVTFGGASGDDGVRKAGSHDGYYITELRKSDRLPFKQ